ncbi:MAG: response regulator [Planctomycetota bacterium]|nr:response regulator [Planctomycetota bacterium]
MDRLEILMVEDNGGDVVLLDEAFTRAGIAHRVNVISDGAEAIEFLRRQGPYAQAPRPDVIVLDLKLPRKGGREVLDEILPDPDLGRIPIVVLSSSQTELEVVVKKYRLPEGFCIAKPSTFAGYIGIAKTIGAYGHHVTGNQTSLTP